MAIRPLERTDLPDVARLVQDVMALGSTGATSALEQHLAALFLDHPWFDPDLPSLVSTNREGRLIGFIGSSVRRMRFRDRPIRLACSGPLVVETASRAQAVGAFLLNRYMSGPQDLTITDGATDDVRRMWERFGGEVAMLPSIRWTQPLRPLSFGISRFLEPDRATGRVALPLARGIDRLVRTALPKVVAPRPVATRGERLTPEALIDCLAHVDKGLLLRPDYDAEFLQWQFGLMRSLPGKGTLRPVLVRDAGGETIGWFVYFALPTSICRVFQVGGVPERLSEVLDHLARDAFEHKGGVLDGRIDGHLREALRGRRVIVRQHETLPLIHARDPEIVAAIQSGRALLTRLEGEAWMGVTTETFEEAA